jgi:flagellar basal body-associated protein FliL
MLDRIVAALKTPFALATFAALLLVAGAAAGLFAAGKMAEAEARKIAQAKAAAAAAARAHIPERVPAPPESEDPFKPRYVSLGEEILHGFREPKRALVLEVTLMTQRGDLAEKLIAEKRVPLRALVLANLSEFPVAIAAAPGGQQELSNRLKAALNAELRAQTGFAPIDAVLLTRYFVQ